jgi:hypothetical protein
VWIKMLIARLFYIGYTVEGTWKADAPPGLVGPGSGPPGDGTRRGRDRDAEKRGMAAAKAASATRRLWLVAYPDVRPPDPGARRPIFEPETGISDQRVSASRHERCQPGD